MVVYEYIGSIDINQSEVNLDGVQAALNDDYHVVAGRGGRVDIIGERGE